ncbi:DEAD-domain-containing protein [Schizopora paradoxa]|uniref:RNA helicase n=1 Tax=Schizopora paradoxa TaxID=27342 RepID=A0A0H2RHA4_9AGAM|nr:DEAD-domain-containing protein [Schizopora paradoxa]
MAAQSSKAKRKSASTSQSSSRKKQKRVVDSISELPWKSVSRPANSGFEGDEGILELEEVDDVEIVYEETENGRVMKFKVSESTLDDAQNNETSGEDEDSPLEETIKDDILEVEEDFDASVELPEWAAFNLHPLITRSLHKQKFMKPTPIQSSALPAALKGKDVVGIAETGSGKTLAYGIPILQYLLSQPPPSKLSTRSLKALILAPTRELALQVATHLRACIEEGDKGKSSGPPRVSVAAVIGGMSAQKQRRVLERGADVIVATPGRLWDLLQEDDNLASQVKNIKFLVLDEADRMIEIGHFAELDNIVRLTLRPEEDATVEGDVPPQESPDALQTFVFSATLSRDLQQNLKKRKRAIRKKSGSPSTTLDELLLKLDFRDPDPEIIDFSPKGGVVSTLKESRIDCVTKDKDVYLYYFLLRYTGRSLVFLSAIDGIRRLLPLLELLQVKAFPLHSQLQQRQRLKNLDRFKSTPNSVLLATDIAARGLDIPSVDHVIHYQIPRTADTYIHRNGRTARASRDGFSLLMCAPEEKRVLKALMSSLHREGENEIPEMPIELDLLDKLKNRIQLAKKIDVAQHKVKKEKHEKNWLRETAEAMEIDLDSDLASEEEESTNKRKEKDSQQTIALKAELKKLLAQPLVASGAYKKYLTSGSRAIVDDLLNSQHGEGLLGFTRSDAKTDLLNGKKTKAKAKKPAKVKSTTANEDGEWTGFDS